MATPSGTERVAKAIAPLRLYNVSSAVWEQFQEAETTFDFELGLDVSHLTPAILSTFERFLGTCA